jgi:hypothetical protein
MLKHIFKKMMQLPVSARIISRQRKKSMLPQDYRFKSSMLIGNHTLMIGVHILLKSYNFESHSLAALLKILKIIINNIT